MNQPAQTTTLPTSRSESSLLSVVLPVFNEKAVLHRLFAQVIAGLSSCEMKYEIIFVNDGSSDGSLEELELIAATEKNVRVIHFSRNFGHQAAVHAGLNYAEGDAIILMDSDLQDDPQAIPKFVEEWKQGSDVVYAIRKDRKEGLVKRSLFHSFYRILNSLSETKVPMDAGNFGLVDQKVATEICSFIERDRYYPGLRSWVGFKQTGIEVERKERHDDEPRVSMWGLFKLAKTALFSFSAVPLTMFYVIAGISLAICFCVGGISVYQQVFTETAAPAWASMMMLGSFLGALNAFGIAILGEYVIRIYDQVRERPSFIVARKTNFETQTELKETTTQSPERSTEELLDWLDSTLSEAVKV